MGTRGVSRPKMLPRPFCAGTRHDDSGAAEERGADAAAKRVSVAALPVARLVEPAPSSDVPRRACTNGGGGRSAVSFSAPLPVLQAASKGLRMDDGGQAGNVGMGAMTGTTGSCRCSQSLLLKTELSSAVSPVAPQPTLLAPQLELPLPLVSSNNTRGLVAYVVLPTGHCCCPGLCCPTLLDVDGDAAEVRGALVHDELQ